ncbi:MAG: twin-arginine translocase TatA/TatE family subunit [Chloroflexi bacterium]|nr:twin-arginine translocase TatA/TatE family subunit [Chloroflexota bacterium]
MGAGIASPQIRIGNYISLVARLLLAIGLVFGAARLPQIGESLGKAIRNFRKGLSGDDEKKKEQLNASQADTPETTEGKNKGGSNPPA